MPCLVSSLPSLALGAGAGGGAGVRGRHAIVQRIDDAIAVGVDHLGDVRNIPAHELFAHLFEHGLDPDQVTRKRIVYYHLEGGTLGLDAGIVSELAHAYFVSARDQTVDTLAANYWVSQDLGKKYASSGGSSLVVDVPESGCTSGGRWCLHDAVVNTRPHKPNAYDLERDYQIFEPAPRALQTDFLDATLPW